MAAALFILQAVLATFSVAETAGRPYDGLLCAGVRFSPDAAADPEHLVIRGGGKTVHCPVRVIDRYSGGGIRRGVVRFPVRLSPGAVVPFECVREDPSRPAAEGPGLTIEETPEGIEVRTRALEMLIPADAAVPIARLGRRGTDGATVIGRILHPKTTGLDGSVALVSASSHAAEIVFRGTLRDARGVTFLIVRRTVIDAAAPEIEIETTVRTDDFFGVTEPFLLAFESAAAADLVTTEWGAVRPVKDADRFGSAVSADGTVAPVGFEKTRPPRDISPGAVRGRYPFGAIDLNLEDFERLGPGSVVAEGARTLWATLIDGDYHFSPGVRPTRAVRLFLRAQGAFGGELARWSRPIAYQPNHPGADDTIFAPPAAALALRAPVVEKVLDLWRTPVGRRFGIDWRGLENAGDWRWSASDAGNLEFDTSLGLWCAGKAAADPAILKAAHRAARHLVHRDIDYVRTGLLLRHGAYHRMGGLEAGHVWLEGLLRIADETGDPVLGDAFDEIAPRIVTFVENAPVERWNTRSIAWALVFLRAIADRLGPAAVKPAIARILDRLEEKPGGDFILIEPIDEETGQSTVSTWVGAGILGAGLAAVRGIDARETIERRFARMVEAMSLEAWDPKEKTLADRIIVDRQGEAVRARGLSTGEQMLFFALGGRYAIGLGAVAERTRKDIAAAAVTRLDLDRKVLKGKEASQILWLAPRLFGRSFLK